MKGATNLVPDAAGLSGPHPPCEDYKNVAPTWMRLNWLVACLCTFCAMASFKLSCIHLVTSPLLSLSLHQVILLRTGKLRALENFFHLKKELIVNASLGSAQGISWCFSSLLKSPGMLSPFENLCLQTQILLFYSSSILPAVGRTSRHTAAKPVRIENLISGSQPCRPRGREKWDIGVP